MCWFLMTFVMVQLIAVRPSPQPKDATFHRSPSSDRVIHLSMENCPMNLTLLDSDPQALEEPLKHGRWLIVFYSIFNPQDALMKEQTVQIADDLVDICRVAIRPTRGFEGIEKWLPEAKAEMDAGHPVYFAIQDGKLVGMISNPLSKKETREFVEKSFTQNAK
jgi:hypothetical protein